MKNINKLIAVIAVIWIMVCINGLESHLIYEKAMSRKCNNLQCHEIRYQELSGMTVLKCRYEVEIARFHIARLNNMMGIKDRLSEGERARKEARRIYEMAPGYSNLKEFIDYIDKK